MGECEICSNKNIPCQPINQIEYQKLYSYKSALCKINFNSKKEGKILNCCGTGFFCQLDENDIPFKKALFTNNHVLNEQNIKINKKIRLEYLNEPKIIEITKDRRKFTSELFDYTCIEIFEEDNIKKFFKIDKSFFQKEEIFILQHPLGGKISHSVGRINEVKNNIINHTASTLGGSSGSPLIKRSNIDLILGIHFGAEGGHLNLGTPFSIIIEDIKYKLTVHQKINLVYHKNNNNNSKLYLNDYNTYKKYYNPNRLFGSKFVENNEYNIKLMINGRESKLVEEYDLKEGINNIQMIILNILTNLEEMFSNCISLKNIDELKYLDTREVYSFRSMFVGCSSLTDVNALKDWNVSNGNDFSAMFGACSSLTDINGLINWNVSNGSEYIGMFSRCSALSDIKGLRNWDVSKGKNFTAMFIECKSLKSLKGLENWNVSNSTKLIQMFSFCQKLKDINALLNWNVSNVENFSFMFNECSALSDISALKNWDVSKCNVFDSMFQSCSFKNLNGLENWNVSNGYNFKAMFCSCKLLLNINSLKNWDVSKGKNFSGMFASCYLLSDISPIRNWNVSNGEDFSYMFQFCSSLSDILVLKNWKIPKGINPIGLFSGCSSLLRLEDIVELSAHWLFDNEEFI